MYRFHDRVLKLTKCIPILTYIIYQCHFGNEFRGVHRCQKRISPAAIFHYRVLTVDSRLVFTVFNTITNIPNVPFLPSGLSIVPYHSEGRAQCGSMVTVAFQILLPNRTISYITTATINQMNRLVSRTILSINNEGKQSCFVKKS